MRPKKKSTSFCVGVTHVCRRLLNVRDLQHSLHIPLVTIIIVPSCVCVRAYSDMDVFDDSHVNARRSHLGSAVSWLGSVWLLVRTKPLFGVMLFVTLVMAAAMVHYIKKGCMRYSTHTQYYGIEQAYVKNRKETSSSASVSQTSTRSAPRYNTRGMSLSQL